MRRAVVVTVYRGDDNKATAFNGQSPHKRQALCRSRDTAGTDIRPILYKMDAESNV